MTNHHPPSNLNETSLLAYISSSLDTDETHHPRHERLVAHHTLLARVRELLGLPVDPLQKPLPDTGRPGTDACKHASIEY